MESIYMSPAEAAKRYGVGRNAIYDIMALPDSPPTLKIGQRRCLPVAAFDEFVEKTFTQKKGESA